MSDRPSYMPGPRDAIASKNNSITTYSPDARSPDAIIVEKF